MAIEDSTTVGLKIPKGWHVIPIGIEDTVLSIVETRAKRLT